MGMETANVGYVVMPQQVQKKENKSKLLPDAAIGFAFTSIPAYVFNKEPISAKNTLEMDSDTFESTFKKIAQGNKDTINSYRISADEVKQTAIGNAEFLMGNRKEVTVEEFLKARGYKNLKTKDEFNKYFEGLKAKNAELTTNKDTAEKNVKEAETKLNAADEAKKAEAQTELEKANDVLKKANDELHAHTESLNEQKLYKDIINTEKDGIIKDAGVKDVCTKKAHNELLEKIGNTIKELGEEAPKERSLKTAGKIGLIGAAIFGLGSFIFGGNKTES